MKQILKSFIQKSENLPTVPKIANKIISLTNDPMLSIDGLKNIVERDPAISAKILSVANSSFFGFPVHTRVLSDAIMRIGFKQVKSIAFGLSILTIFGGSKTTSNYKRVFNHSVAVGLSARLMSRHLQLDFEEDIMSDGLLHDLGYLVLDRYSPDIFQKITGANQNALSLLEAEKTILDCTHADVGYWLAEHWKLPETTFHACLYHHAPSLARRNEKHVATIHIADHLVSSGILSPIEQNGNCPLDRHAMDILGISDDDLKHMEKLLESISLSDDIINMPHQTNNSAADFR